MEREDAPGVNPNSIFTVCLDGGSISFRFGSVSDWRTYKQDIKKLEGRSGGLSADDYRDEVIRLIGGRVDHYDGSAEWEDLLTLDQLFELYWGLPVLSILSEREVKKYGLPVVSLTGQFVNGATEASVSSDPPQKSLFSSDATPATSEDATRAKEPAESVLPIVPVN